MNQPSRLASAAGVASGLIAAGLGGASLVAWGAGGWRAARGPDGIPIGPITGLLFVILGLSLAALIRWPDNREVRRAGLAASAATFLASLLAAGQWGFEYALPWDRWLIGAERMVGAMPLGRISPLTIIAFLFTSAAFAAQLAPTTAPRAVRWTALLGSAIGFAIGLEVVASYASGTPRYYGGATTPMEVLTAAAFVALNFGLLARSVLHGTAIAWLQPAPPGESRQFRGRELLAMGLILGLIAAAGLFYLRREQTSARAAARQQLDAVASLKAAQIQSWRNERLGEARFLLRTRAVAHDVAALVARPTGLEEQSRLTDWLEPIRGGTRYERALVYDPSGRLLLATPESKAPPSHVPAETFQAALRGVDVMFSELYRSEEVGVVRLDILVPVRLRGAEPAVAVIVLRLDPREFLFPLIREWPVPSDTAETLLVRREGDEVVYLSERRHLPGAPLTLRRSMNEPFLPAARGLRGEVGVREGLDYRGAAVLATSRPILGSPWVLVVKVDQSEAYGAIRRAAWQTAVLVALLMLALVLAGGYFSWQRRSESLQRALAAERERNLMGERLALITRYANDMILLTDDHARIFEANERAIATYGYTLDELRALPEGGLRAPETTADLERQLAGVRSAEGGLYETLHRRKDGSIFPVEISGRLVTIDGRRLLLAVIRDITERKKHLAEIERINRLYAAHSQVNQAIVRSDSRDVLLYEVCRSLVEFGRFPMAWIGWPDPESGRVDPVAQCGDASSYLQKILVTMSGARSNGPAGLALKENRTVVFNDFLNDPCTTPWHEAGAGAGFRSAIGIPVRPGGVVQGVLTVYANEIGFFGAPEIAVLEEAALDAAFGLFTLEREERRRQAEQALRDSEERLRLALMAGKQGLYDLNVQTGSTVVSREYVTMLGYDPDAFEETNAAWLDRLHPDDREGVGRVYLDYIAGRRPDYEVEFRQRTKSGEWKWIYSVGQILERDAGGAPLRMLGTHTDVTDRRNAEEALQASLREKEALLKEVHHRVKNNLQVITSLLRLETSRSTEASTKVVLRDMQGRIRSMALLHETLYRSGNFARVDLADYLRQLATQLFRMQNPDASRVHLATELEAARVEIDQAIPCGLIVNELLTNCLKYAFVDGRTGEVRVRLGAPAPGLVRIAVIDNGAGLPEDFEARRARSLGLTLVSDLVKQLAGTLEIGPGPGAGFTFTFKPRT
ncbi:MAG: PAS domain S-box protein [Vicinamibacteria bacterium]